ncbi:MAG: (E)-4-hydroxy-3-methylbut-2-enyl-diphosphate synthase [Bacteroidales bacterium]|nr:(E)-4-hydroxy-3-methylbut-2-enyl-diphosphate synthase [Bacteroidales bacterium]
MSKRRYCESLTQFVRIKTPAVSIGGIMLGGDNPIRVQTMATTSTNDTEATVNQCIRSADAGAELFRITAPSIKEAKNLANIKNELMSKGCKIPLVADIHFNPEVAIEAALYVEKVRINPGNYVDPRAKFDRFEYTDVEYNIELKKVEERFLPLLNLCSKKEVAIRIGVNHGSLSDRIMSRYGDTPAGMVESAMEFLRICHKQNFKNVVISMKASNTRVMVQSTRLLVSSMMEEGMLYPLHLGVTEAGEGEDGRIKSAVGIGTLLADGIGDTIRVSLTEEPEYEIPVAKKLVAYFENRKTEPFIPEIVELPYDPFSYNRRKTLTIGNIGGNNPPGVIADLSNKQQINKDDLIEWGWAFDSKNQSWTSTGLSADYLFFGRADISNLKNLQGLSIVTLVEKIEESDNPENPTFLIITLQQLSKSIIETIKKNKNTILILKTTNKNGYAEQRAAFIQLMNVGIENPVIVHREYDDSDVESFQLKSAADFGALLIDGLGDGIMISSEKLSSKIVCSTAFSVLQAARTRTTKTEYISCPGCGRTLYNLQATLAKIKEATGHLKGLKIGVMGCIVNGPGEMADADYGYVGSGNGKVSLYRGKEVQKKNISEDIAVEELISLIKENGDWKEKEQ